MLRHTLAIVILSVVSPIIAFAESPAGLLPTVHVIPWTFVSMPDFVNVDTDYPQPGWEAALDVVLTGVTDEEPEFLLVAGDLLMGHWNTADDIRRRGFVPVGRVVLEKGPTGKRFVGAEGYFDPKLEPAKPESYRPYGQSEPPRVTIDSEPAAKD